MKFDIAGVAATESDHQAREAAEVNETIADLAARTVDTSSFQVGGRFNPRRADYNGLMSIEELEAAALKLEPSQRARLAERLLDSLENLTPEENARLWAEEAQRRSDALDAGTLHSRAAEDVFRDARLATES